MQQKVGQFAKLFPSITFTRNHMCTNLTRSPRECGRLSGCRPPSPAESQMQLTNQRLLTSGTEFQCCDGVISNHLLKNWFSLIGIRYWLPLPQIKGDKLESSKSAQGALTKNLQILLVVGQEQLSVKNRSRKNKNTRENSSL